MELCLQLLLVFLEFTFGEKQLKKKVKQKTRINEVRKGSLAKSSKAVEICKETKDRASQHLQITDYLKPGSNSGEMSSQADTKGDMPHSTGLKNTEPRDTNENDKKSENICKKLVANSYENGIKSSPSNACPGLMSSKEQEEPDLSRLKPGDRTALKFDDEIVSKVSKRVNSKY